MSESHLERVRQLFDYWAEGGYAEIMEREYGLVARHVFDKVGLRPHQRLLDIGCGNGYLCRWVAEAGGLALGIDGSPRMIERAKRASKSVRGVEFRRAFFPADFLVARSYDVVFAMESLYYLPDVPGALRRAAELLVPGGTLACVCSYYWENQDSHVWPQQSGVPMAMATEAQWAQAVSDAGLIVMVRERVFHGPGAGAICLLARKPA